MGGYGKDASRGAEQSRLISAISKRSDCYGDKLVEFMIHYGLSCLAAAEVWQLEEFIRQNFGEGALQKNDRKE